MDKLALTDHVLVPVANVEDAQATADTLTAYQFEDITVLHVVEKGEGVPDKKPMEQSEEIAAEAFEKFKETFPDAKSEITYRRDVVDAIIEIAEELDVNAIVFLPRGGGRILQFLAGDRALRLITEAKQPVIALPSDLSDP